MAAQVSLQPNALDYTLLGGDIGNEDSQFHVEDEMNDDRDVDGEDSESNANSDDSDLVDEDWDVREQLNTDLSLIQRTGDFYAYFRPSPEAPNPGLEIEGLRRFGMPLQEHDIHAIIAECHRAPYGKGTETIVNEAVRKTWEIDGHKIKLRHPAWPAELEKIVSTACDQLGVAGGTSVVEAQLYKLLVYEEGAMFKPHKESVSRRPVPNTFLADFPQFRKGASHVWNLGRLLAFTSYGRRTHCLVQRRATHSGHSAVLRMDLNLHGMVSCLLYS